ncbi:hypothetical protein D3C79_870580 [compost metagenome]
MLEFLPLHPLDLTAAGITGRQTTILGQACQGLGPAETIDPLGVLHLFGVVTIGAGHAAATHRHRLQPGAKALEQAAPVAVSRGLGGLLGAVGEQIPGRGLALFSGVRLGGWQLVCW